MAERKTHSADLSDLRIDHPSESDRNDRTGKSRIVLSGIAVVSLIIFTLFWFFSGKQAVSKLTLKEVAYVHPSKKNTILTASGYVVAQRQAAVASKGTGRLELLRVEEGDEVKKGHIIARLEHNDVDASLKQAEANLEMAKALLRQNEADLHEARLNHQRQKGLLAKGLIADSEYEIAEARFKSAEAAVASGKAQIKLAEATVLSAQVEVENTRIRAPFDGTVLTKNADIGEIVAPFAASSNSRGAVVTIADMTSLEVEADVSEANIQRVNVRQACEIILDAFPDIRYPGYVHKIVPTADRAKATVLTKIRFKKRDEKVLPEMSAKVNFLATKITDGAASRQPFLAVPKSALVKKNYLDIVFVVRDETVIEMPVSLGKKYGDLIEVLEGVSLGDKIVLNPRDDLKSGLTVTEDSNE
ncbi:MAG: efflux RND transporter periplasmic adaptor subunit [bacterium]